MYIIWYMCAWVCVLGVSVAGIVLVVVYIYVCVCMVLLGLLRRY